MKSKYDQLHTMTIYPTKYESYRTNDLKGVAFTMWSGTYEQIEKRRMRDIKELAMRYKRKKSLCYQHSKIKFLINKR